MSKEVTIVMVPRERYSGIVDTIVSMYENTETPFDLIVVDGALPENVQKEIESLKVRHGFSFIHKPYPLNPNEARNIGLEYVDSPYVVFSDNDIIFTKGWLSKLLDTAKEYSAWLVGPTILDGHPADGCIHATAGISGFVEKDGKRHYEFVPGNVHKNLADVGALQRGPVSMLEFHVILCATHIFSKIGKLDERVSSFGDHDDLVMSVQELDGPIIYEPESIVGYHDPGTNIDIVDRSDLPYYLLRWSDEWNFGSVDRAAEKWSLSEDAHWMPHAKHWARVRRRKAYFIGGFWGRVVGFCMFKVSRRLGELLERVYCQRYTKDLLQLRQLHLG